MDWLLDQIQHGCMQEHTLSARSTLFTMSIFIHFIMDDSWIWHFTSRFQSAALNKVKNLFFKKRFALNLFDSEGEYSIFFTLTEFRRLWSPTSSKHCPLFSFKSPTSVEWSWPSAFDFPYHSGTTLHVWFNCLGCLWVRIWFAIPKGCESQWMCLYWTCPFEGKEGLFAKV